MGQRLASFFTLLEPEMIRQASISLEALRKGEEIERVGQRAVKLAQEENRRLGIPNVYSINGIIYYELPNGELSRTDPYQPPAKSSEPS
jgi:hypothetical protein